MNVTQELIAGLESIRPDVLVVEDQEISLNFMMTCLQLLGCTVCSAMTTAEGLAMYAQRRERVKSGHPYDCVLVDVHIPEKNGIQFMREIRAIDPSQPGAFVSAAVSDDEMREIQGLGFTGFIEKDNFMENAKNYLSSMGLYREIKS